MSPNILTTFLCVGERSDSIGAEFLNLLAGTVERGLSITIATHPIELIHAKNSDRAINILVIDCVESSAFDIPHLISVIRADRHTGIIVLVENHIQRMKALAAGADLAMRLPLEMDRFLLEVREIAGYYMGTPVNPRRAYGPADGHVDTAAAAGGAVACDADMDTDTDTDTDTDIGNETDTDTHINPNTGHGVDVANAVPAIRSGSFESSPRAPGHVTTVAFTRRSQTLYGREGMWEPVALTQARSRTPPRFNAATGKLVNSELSPWRLLWNKRILQTPDGQPIPLTKLEHLFITTIFSTRDSRVTYELWSEIATPRSPDVSRHLAVLVCHVRAKCMQAGMAIPIRVERGGGYRFAGLCAIQKGLRSEIRHYRTKVA